ncbi:DUF805 domain-containing protein [Massilia sp. CCM 8733]|uniref:DUF805 domain-containing protein n=1 Tax=Massilia mucilaginosa TaxID=2609282 RepID=A0ABX0NQL1_9BURK|nr:DUF805 domain-containing protein [Massilia mucilaginosa]NHZ89166.1 DUF805 domain-containing protein [Massilia mucilaginosa]
MTRHGGSGQDGAVARTGGRIGRLRYLVYTMLPGVLLFLLMVFLTGRHSPFGLIVHILLMETLPLVVALCFTAIATLMTARRLRDIGVSPWCSLLMLVPAVNGLLACYLLCKKGDPAPNRYGPAPPGNTMALAAGAWCLAPLAGVPLVLRSLGG